MPAKKKTDDQNLFGDGELSQELIDQAPMGNEEDARAAIAAANEAFKRWRKTTAHEKAELLPG